MGYNRRSGRFGREQRYGRDARGRRGNRRFALDRKSQTFCADKEKNHFVDIYKAEKDFDTENCILDPLEVDAVKWVSADELLAYAFDRHEKTYDAIVKALVSGR